MGLSKRQFPVDYSIRLKGRKNEEISFYRSFATFQFQPYRDKINVSKYLQAYSKLCMSSHRLEVESGRWVCYEMGKTSISMFEILEPGGSALGKYSI